MPIDSVEAGIVTAKINSIQPLLSQFVMSDTVGGDRGVGAQETGGWEGYRRVESGKREILFIKRCKKM